jgi:hypothetical protein
MKIRFSAITATITLLALAADNRVCAQPIVPVSRPQTNSFQNLFFPGSTVVPNAGTNLYGLNRIVPAGQNTALTPGFGTQSYYGPWSPYVLNMQPVVFNNRGHWYSNYYGHWYPNGLTNGTGVISNGGTASGSRLGGGTGVLGVPTLGAGGLGVPGGLPGGVGVPGAGGMPSAVPVIGGPNINR